MAEDAEVVFSAVDKFSGPANQVTKSVQNLAGALQLGEKESARAVAAGERLTASMVSQSKLIQNAAQQQVTAVGRTTGEQRKNVAQQEALNKAGAKAAAEYDALITKSASGRYYKQGVSGQITAQQYQAERQAAMDAAKANLELAMARQTSAKAAEQATRANAAQLNALRAGPGMTPAVPYGSAGILAEATKAQGAAAAASRTIMGIKWPPAFVTAGQKFFGDLTQQSNSLRYALYDVSSTLTIAGGAIAAFGTAAVVAAAKHEQLFATVRRTVQTTPEGYDILNRQLEEMAMRIPVAYEGIAQIAANAGQLGISSAGIAAFTETVAKLEATTNLTGESAANFLARFRSLFTEIDDNSFDNLASSLLKVGVNSIATESGIVNVATQISSMGKYAGFTAAQTIGLAGALSSVAVPPELARGLTTRMFREMSQAIMENGQRLHDFSAIAGVSSDEFKNAWGKESFAPIFTSFLDNLGAMQRETNGANNALMSLGITGDRDVPVWTRLAGAMSTTNGAMSITAQTMRDAETGYKDTTEFAVQYATVSETLNGRLKVLGNTFEQLFATLGSSSVGPLKELINLVIDVVKWFEKLANNPVAGWFATVALAVTTLFGGLLLLGGMAAATAASAQGLGFAIEQLGFKAATASVAVGVLSKAMIAIPVIGLIAAIGGIVAGLIETANSSKKTNDALTDTSTILAAMKKDAEAGSGFAVYGDGLDATGKASDEAAASADALRKAFGKVKDGANEGADGVDTVNQALYRFGDNAHQAVKDALYTSDAIKDMYDTAADQKFMENIGFSIDDLIDMSASGKDISDAITSKFGDIRLKLFPEIDPNDFNAMEGAYKYVEMKANQIEGAVGGISGDLQAGIAMANAFGVGVSDANKLAAGSYDELSDTSQKALDGITSAYQKFVDIGNLIKLTQDRQTQSGDEFAKTWQDAYGGAEFSLAQYMETFQGASQEQADFYNGISLLQSRFSQLNLDQAVLADISAMGPAGAQMVQALINGSNPELAAFVDLYGKTGYDAMVEMAAQQQLASYIPQALLSQVGYDALVKFNEALASGMGTTEALQSLNKYIDEQGNIVDIPTDVTPPPQESVDSKNRLLQEHLNRAGIKVPVGSEFPTSADTADKTGKVQQQVTNARVTIPTWISSPPDWTIWSTLNHVASIFSRGVTIPVRIGGASGGGQAGISGGGGGGGANGGYMGTPGMYHGGGYTGPGGKYRPAGIVHAGEFVFTQKATRAIGVDNLYAAMRAESLATPNRRGGYANGGYVAPAATGPMDLSAGTIQALANALATRIYLDGKDIGNSANAYYNNQNRRGAF